MEMEGAEKKGGMSVHDALEESRAAMEEIAAKILSMKKDAGKPKSDLPELITQMSLIFISLRRINRAILLEEDHVKTETENAKVPVDITTLQLHNLMYEKNHYLKAIKACKDFKSKYPNIELVPEEEFFLNASDDIKGKVLSTDPAHDLMLKRLNYELFQRKELCKLHEKLEQRKKGLLETIAKRKQFLTSLPSHLKSLKKASLPVQQQLGILHTKKLKQHHAAELLPPPLYIIYSQLVAQKEAFGEKIDMEILGSIKDAQTFAQKQANDGGFSDTGTSTNVENYRLVDDIPDEEDDAQRRRKRSKKNTAKDNVDQAGIYQSHPLRVIVHIYDDDEEGPKQSKLTTLRFDYLVKMYAVCVGVGDAEEGSDDDILCNLFPDDTGTELPHQMAKLYTGDSAGFSDRKSSRPYKWVQHLAGIDILPEVPPMCSSSKNPVGGLKEADLHSGLSLYRQQNRAQTILQRIRYRKKAQMALVEQLDSLAKLKWPSLTYGNVPWASHSPLCTLKKWSQEENFSNSNSVIGGEQIADSQRLVLDKSSVTSWEVESAREDGELPTGQPGSALLEDTRVTTLNGSSVHDHSKSSAFMSKSVTVNPPKKGKPQYMLEDDSELLLDSDTEVEDKVRMDIESDKFESHGVNAWEEYASKEYNLILSRKNQNGRTVKLEAKVKISMEYPLRPPLFTLSLSAAGTRDYFEWYNELRAMEAKVNLHVLEILPSFHENYILAHQVRFLAMLFDFQFDMHDKGKSASVIDVGLCKPVSGTILARSFRGRDRRRIISWKGMCCDPGYPG